MILEISKLIKKVIFLFQNLPALNYAHFDELALMIYRFIALFLLKLDGLKKKYYYNCYFFFLYFNLLGFFYLII